MTVGWVLDAADPETGKENALDSQERLALQVLDHLLLSTPASPLYKALVASKIGKAVVKEGLDLSMRHATFVTGLNGEPQTQPFLHANPAPPCFCAVCRKGRG